MLKANSKKPYVPQSMLFLQGVFKRDCSRPDEYTPDNFPYQTPIPGTKSYDKIPVNFISIETWFKTTNIHCWYCSRGFKGRPWFEPQSIEPICESSNGGLLNRQQLMNSNNKKSTSIVITGIFCSCNCVRAYIDLHTKDIADRHNKVEMLKYVYQLFNGKKIADIQASPSPMEMTKFGGYLTESEYQQKIESLDASYQKELEDNNFASLCNMFKKQQALNNI